jgi:ribosome biogenesis GTPase
MFFIEQKITMIGNEFTIKSLTVTTLYQYGWNSQLLQLKQLSAHKELPHGRVAVVHRTCYEVISEGGLFQCELSGNMIYGKLGSELPCTGDWIIFQPFNDNQGVIIDILPRQRALYRRKSGTIAEKQTIASYVDKAFIVQSLDNNFNVRRIERFMVQILEENIRPVLILHKADLQFDKQEIDHPIQHISRKLPVFITSIHHPETILSLRASILEGETVVFVGSSGVGKSSLVNALCEKPVLQTSEVSESTGKGRHTSTRREMLLMNEAGVLIDTPGVREFGLAVENPDALAETLEISDYAELCRFANCTHTKEPGCAVIDALNTGILDSQVYESYLKLRREAWHFSASEHEKRKKEKSFSKITKEIKKNKGKC